MNEPLRLLKEVLGEENDLRRLTLLGRACKLISDLLIIEKKEELPFDTELFKHLLICSALNRKSVIYLVEALLDKYKDRALFICYIWNAAQFIASFEEKNDKRHEGSFLANHIQEVKENTLKLLPSLFQASVDKPGVNFGDKIDIFKLFSKHSKNQQFQLEVQQMMGLIREKHYVRNKQEVSVERRAGGSVFENSEFARAEQATFQIVEFQTWLAKDLGLHLYDFPNYQCFSKEDNLRVLFTFVVFPDQHEVLEEVWEVEEGEPSQTVYRSNIRSLRTTHLLSNGQNIQFLNELYPECCSLYFRLLQQLFKKIDKRTIIINHITALLQAFLVHLPSCFISALVRFRILRGIYIYLENEFVFALFYSMLSPFSSKALGPGLYTKLLDVLDSLDFFREIMVNIGKKDFLLLKKRENSKAKETLRKELSEEETAGKPLSRVPDFRLLGFFQKPEEFTGVKVSEARKGKRNQSVMIKSKSLDDLDQKKSKTLVQRIVISPDHVLGAIHPKHKPADWALSLMSEVFLAHPDLKLRPRTYGYNREKFKALYSLRKEAHSQIEQEHAEMANGVAEWCLANCELLLMLVHDSLVAAEFSPGHQSRLLVQKLLDPCAISPLLKIYYSKIMFQVSQRGSYQNRIPVGSTLGRLILLLLQNLESPVVAPLRGPLLHAFADNLSAYQNLLVLLQSFERNVIFIEQEAISYQLDYYCLHTARLLRLILQRSEARASLVERVGNGVWHILMVWFLEFKLNNLFQHEFVQIMRLSFAVGSQSFMTKIVLKLGLLTSLYQAYEDIVKNSVLMSHWNVEDFLAAIRELFLVIEFNEHRHPEFTVLRDNLARFHSWEYLRSRLSRLKCSASETNFSST